MARTQLPSLVARSCPFTRWVNRRGGEPSGFAYSGSLAPGVQGGLTRPDCSLSLHNPEQLSRNWRCVPPAPFRRNRGVVRSNGPSGGVRGLDDLPGSPGRPPPQHLGDLASGAHDRCGRGHPVPHLRRARAGPRARPCGPRRGIRREGIGRPVRARCGRPGRERGDRAPVGHLGHDAAAVAPRRSGPASPDRAWHRHRAWPAQLQRGPRHRPVSGYGGDLARPHPGDRVRPP